MRIPAVPPTNAGTPPRTRADTLASSYALGNEEGPDPQDARKIFLVAAVLQDRISLVVHKCL